MIRKIGQSTVKYQRNSIILNIIILTTKQTEHKADFLCQTCIKRRTDKQQTRRFSKIRLCRNARLDAI